MKKNVSERGSLSAVIITVLFVALLATLGVVFYQNFIQKKPEAKPQQTVQKPTGDTMKTARVAFDNKIYALDYPDNWKVVQQSKNEASVYIQDTAGTVETKFVVSDKGIDGVCNQAAEEKISSYNVQDAVNTQLTGESLALVESIFDHVDGGYDYHIGLTEDGGATHAAIGDAFCNVADVGVASSLKLGVNNTVERPFIVAEVRFPKLGDMEKKPASQDMDTLKTMMQSDDYKTAVKILESARKE